MQDSLGDRMKINYELPSRHLLTRRVPVIVRVDGRAFHTYTRGMQKPFDTQLVGAMVIAAQETAKTMQGFTMGYVQSDEASFLLRDDQTLESQPWFGNVQSKIETITASTMTAWFNLYGYVGKTGVFDGRAHNIPETEVANYFLWRALDWQRNSIAMCAQAQFSAKELRGKKREDQLAMLSSVGVDWNALPPNLKYGTFILPHTQAKTETDGWAPTTLRTRNVEPTYANISELLFT